MTILYKNKEYKRVISNFSCGAASAVATKLAIDEFGVENVTPVYQVTNAEHEDNARFILDCEKWFGVKVQKQKSEKFNDIFEVFEKRRYLAGIAGAPCTSELKRKVAESHLDWFNDLEIFGYTVEEHKRVENFITNNEERRIYPILVDHNINKADCYRILQEAGIELPTMYLLGYRNNNCIGCVKGGMGYWNKIRVDFPDAFDNMAKLERKFNAAICKSYKGDGKRKRVFLDELDPEAGNYKSEPSISCGVMCEREEA